MAKRVIIWDWNGTLVNDNPLFTRIFSEIAVECGLNPVDDAQYRELYQHPIVNMYRDAGFDLDSYSFDDLSHQWHQRVIERLSEVLLHHDVEGILEEFSKKNFTQLVLSAYNHNLLLDWVAQYNIGHYFTGIFGVNDFEGHGKVSLGRQVVVDHGISPEDAVLIGDSLHDLEVAQAIGTSCILVARGNESVDRLRSAGESNGVAVLDSFAGLGNLINSL